MRRIALALSVLLAMAGTAPAGVAVAVDQGVAVAGVAGAGGTGGINCLLSQAAGNGGNVRPTPNVSDPKLKNLVSDLYKGAKGRNPIGTGSTADAVRNELSTGLPTHGRFHAQKAQEYINALSNWLRCRFVRPLGCTNPIERPQGGSWNWRTLK